MVELKTLKKGTPFTVQFETSKKSFLKGDYCKERKMYLCPIRYESGVSYYLEGSTPVEVQNS